MNGYALGSLMITGIICLVSVWAWAKIFRKAGFAWWNAFAMIIPVLNLLALIWFALSDWPVEIRTESPVEDSVRD